MKKCRFLDFGGGHLGFGQFLNFQQLFGKVVHLDVDSEYP